MPERPLEGIFRDEGYRETQTISIGRYPAALQLMPLIMRLAVRLMRAFVDGYTVRVCTPS